MNTEGGRLVDGNRPIVVREINGVRYSVTRLGWWDAQDALALLDDVLGPALAEAAKAVVVHEGEPTVEWGELLAALPGAVARASRAGGPGRALQELLGKQTMVDHEGRKVFLEPNTLAIWFSQRPDDAVPWLLFSVEVQVWDFFARLADRLGIKRARESHEQARGDDPYPSRSI